MSHQRLTELHPSYLEAAKELQDNPQQWLAYESTGHCVVLAGPGSGKTKTLTVKMARMLAEDVNQPRGLACITYSNECARELKRRLNLLGVRESQNVFVGTVHQFCFKHILVPYGRLAGLDLPEPIAIASESEQKEFMKKAWELVFGNSKKFSKTRVDFYRRTYIDRKHHDWRNKNAQIAKVIERYESLLRQNGLIDFDDMILIGKELIENYSWIRRLVHAKFPILVIDEYQDLGIALDRMVQHLCFNTGIRLFAVGDPDQSIYGFTGAQPSLLRELAKRQNVESVRLKLNYRCGETIIRASKIVIERDTEYKAPENTQIGTVDFHKYPEGLEEQALQICNVIIPDALTRGNGNRKLGDIAVLYLDKFDGDVIAKAAKEAGFNFIRIDGNAPYRKSPLTRWLEDCASWCSDGWKEGVPRLSDLMYTWLGFAKTISPSNEGLLSLKRSFVKFLWDHRQPKTPLSVWLNEFYDCCLEDVLYDNSDLRNELEVFEQLRNAATLPNGGIANFTVPTFAGQTGSPTHLNLITLHSAKGLEFDVVIMMGLEQGRIPWQNDNQQKIAEKRRLFYVGLTRAKSEVHLTYSGWYTQWGNRYEYGPSQFLKQLQTNLYPPLPF